MLVQVSTGIAENMPRYVCSSVPDLKDTEIAALIKEFSVTPPTDLRTFQLPSRINQASSLSDDPYVTCITLEVSDSNSANEKRFEVDTFGSDLFDNSLKH